MTSMNRKWVVALALALATASAVVVGVGTPGSADVEYRGVFNRTVGLYAGSDVTVLGVKVGEVKEITPRGNVVEVSFRLPDDFNVPAAAQAIVVAPTLVSDRHLELTPAYDGGPRLAPGDEIPLNRTAVPMEFDQVLGAVGELATSLGPKGANRAGALDHLVRSGANALQGNGAGIRAVVRDLSDALATADAGGSDLVSTMGSLAQLTSALAEADTPVRQLSRTLAHVAANLASQRGSLVGAVDGLSVAMSEIRALVRESGPALTHNVAGLLDTVETVMKQEQALRETLNLAPVTLQNFIGTFDPQTSALTARPAINGTLTTDPSLVLCQLIASNGLGSLCPALHAALDPVEPLLQSLPQPLGEGAEFSELVSPRAERRSRR